MLVEALMCVALNVYHEARGEPYEGQLAVAEVTYRRVEQPYWPNTACAVVYQPWQFSWVYENPKEPNKDSLEWRTALEAALDGRTSNVTDCATHYFNRKYADPYWAEKLDYEQRIGQHEFYCGR